MTWFGLSSKKEEKSSSSSSSGSVSSTSKLRIRPQISPTRTVTSTTKSAILSSTTKLTSLGSGIMTNEGTVSFIPSPINNNQNKRKNSNRNNNIDELRYDISSKLSSKDCSNKSDCTSTRAIPSSSLTTTTTTNTITSPMATSVQKIIRISCSFLRVADLEMDHDTSYSNGIESSINLESIGGNGNGNAGTATATIPSRSSSQTTINDGGNGGEPNIHHAAVNPPPGIDHDPKERWIALTMDGSHAPIAPIAMDRLANFGLTTSLNQTMWIPDSKTERILKMSKENNTATTSSSDWMRMTFKPGKIRLHTPSSSSTTTTTTTPSSSTIDDQNNEVLVWAGSFKHGFYGSDLPAIRAAGIVNMSAKQLFDLLVDSTRVKEYNKLSLGRHDLVTFDGNLDTPGPFGKSITKVMKSETKPPMIRKNLVFVSILHAKELVDDSGYLIVTRAVHRPEEDKGMANAIKSEILMGVNLIRKIEGEKSSKCLLINVNHIRSPMVPMMVAKRIGVSSAISFMNDIRSLCQ